MTNLIKAFAIALVVAYYAGRGTYWAVKGNAYSAAAWLGGAAFWAMWFLMQVIRLVAK